MRWWATLLLLIAASAHAVTLTYQEGVGSAPQNAAVPDTYIDQANPTFTNGSTTSISANWDGTSQLLRSILEFNVSDIPSGSTITSATLTLNVTVRDNSPSNATTCYRVIRSDWSEAQATWNVYKSGSNWTTAGATSNGNDIDTSVTFTFTAGATGAQTATPTALVADAVANRAGIVRFMCKMDGETGLSHGWTATSSEGTTASQRPKLAIDYTVATTTTTLPGTTRNRLLD